jgi:chemotaxis protein methyltransferase CheR
LIVSQEFEFFRKFLRERSGLVLTPDKQYLLESRLMPVARKAGVASLPELAAKLSRASMFDPLAIQVVEAMTTNESFFFRDKTPFENFQQVMIPHFLQSRAKDRRIKIWCAAASTGQEPYSLAITIREMAAKLAGWRIEITATDLSVEVLEKAKAGIYTQFEVQRGMPINMLLKYFEQSGETWKIDPSLRSLITWKQLNLLDDFRHLGTFDVVFCRNVLIYFDNETKSAVLEKTAKMLAPDGFLVMGAAETVVGLTTTFKPVANQRGLYGLAQASAPAATLSPFAPRKIA